MDGCVVRMDGGDGRSRTVGRIIGARAFGQFVLGIVFLFVSRTDARAREHRLRSARLRGEMLSRTSRPTLCISYASDVIPLCASVSKSECPKRKLQPVVGGTIIINNCAHVGSINILMGFDQCAHTHTQPSNQTYGIRIGRERIVGDKIGRENNKKSSVRIRAPLARMKSNPL